MTEQTETGAAPVAAPDPAAIRAAIAEEAVLKAVLDAVKERYAEKRTEVQYLMDQQYKATGTTKLDAVMPDGTKVGSMTRKGGEAVAKVTDAEAFRVWVRDTYPSEHTVKVIPARTEVGVTPAFEGQILAAATAAGVARWMDPESGELFDVPGVAIAPSSSPTHTLTFARASKADARPGRERVGDAWRSGGLAEILPGLAPMPPAIETAPAAEAEPQHEVSRDEEPPSRPKPAPSRPVSRARVGRRFSAAYDGECQECGGQFFEGDEVAYVDDELCCENCVEAAA